MVRPDLPRRVKVVSLEPARLKLRVERLAQRSLPVRVEVSGIPAPGYKPKPVATPANVEVRGPASKLDELKEIATEPVDVSGASGTLQRAVLLSWAGDFVTFAPDHVTVTISFEEEMMRREFHGVDVRILHVEGARAQLIPSRIDLVIRGPQHVLHNYEVGDGAAYVDAAGLVPGTYRVSARVDLPASLELLKQRPDPLTLHLIAAGTEGGR
jgi:YbbR domain-containing protein